MDTENFNPNAKLEESRKVFKEKTDNIFSGLYKSRPVIGADIPTKYEIRKDKLPSEETLGEFFAAKREYLDEMLKLEKDVEKKRIIELNLQRTGSAEATLKGNSRRVDLVASEFRSISETYRRESESTKTTEYSRRIYDARNSYFKTIEASYLEKHKVDEDLYKVRDFGDEWVEIPDGLYENMSET